MARYGKKAATKVAKALHERKRGTLKSGRSGKTVKSREQAIAIGLSEARRAGGKVPQKKPTSKTAKPKTAANKPPVAGRSKPRKTAKPANARRTPAKKSTRKRK